MFKFTVSGRLVKFVETKDGDTILVIESEEILCKMVRQAETLKGVQVRVPKGQTLPPITFGSEYNIDGVGYVAESPWSKREFGVTKEKQIEKPT